MDGDMYDHNTDSGKWVGTPKQIVNKKAYWDSQPMYFTKEDKKPNIWQKIKALWNKRRMK